MSINDSDWVTPPRPTLRPVEGEWGSTELDFIPDWFGTEE